MTAVMSRTKSRTFQGVAHLSENDEIAETETRYPGIAEALLSYAEVFGCSQQEAADQLRSRDALEGALARPR
jgi:hypothetical protein